MDARTPTHRRSSLSLGSDVSAGSCTGQVPSIQPNVEAVVVVEQVQITRAWPRPTGRPRRRRSAWVGKARRHSRVPLVALRTLESNLVSLKALFGMERGCRHTFGDGVRLECEKRTEISPAVLISTLGSATHLHQILLLLELRQPDLENVPVQRVDVVCRSRRRGGRQVRL